MLRELAFLCLAMTIVAVPVSTAANDDSGLGGGVGFALAQHTVCIPTVTCVTVPVPTAVE